MNRLQRTVQFTSSVTYIPQNTNARSHNLGGSIATRSALRMKDPHPTFPKPKIVISSFIQSNLLKREEELQKEIDMRKETKSCCCFIRYKSNRKIRKLEKELTSLRAYMCAVQSNINTHNNTSTS